MNIKELDQVKMMMPWTRTPLQRTKNRPLRKVEIFLSTIWTTTTRMIPEDQVSVSPMPLSILIRKSRPALGPFSNIKGLTYYRDNNEDPYITLKEVCRLTSVLMRVYETSHRMTKRMSAKNSRCSQQTTSCSRKNRRRSVSTGYLRLR